MVLLVELLFSQSLQTSLLFHDLIFSDWCQEWLKMGVKILWPDSQIPIEQEQELLLHQIHLGDGETEVGKAADRSVSSPVLVLGRRVIQILRGEDEGSQEDPVHCASHALCNCWES